MLIELVVICKLIGHGEYVAPIYFLRRDNDKSIWKWENLWIMTSEQGGGNLTSDYRNTRFESKEAAAKRVAELGFPYIFKEVSRHIYDYDYLSYEEGIRNLYGTSGNICEGAAQEQDAHIQAGEG